MDELSHSLQLESYGHNSDKCNAMNTSVLRGRSLAQVSGFRVRVQFVVLNVQIEHLEQVRLGGR